MKNKMKLWRKEAAKVNKEEGRKGQGRKFKSTITGWMKGGTTDLLDAVLATFGKKQ